MYRTVDPSVHVRGVAEVMVEVGGVVAEATTVKPVEEAVSWGMADTARTEDSTANRKREGMTVIQLNMNRHETFHFLSFSIDQRG